MGKSFIKDFSWYFIGSFIPIIIGVIKTPIFTRHFNQSDFGYLGLVLVTFSFIGMILFSWIGSCVWRYYPKYKERNNLKTLYSNLLFLIVISIIILAIITSTWYFIELGKHIKELIFLSFFYTILNQIYSNYIIVIRIEGKARLYTVLQSVKAFLSFAAALIFVFVFNENISALISSLLVIEFFAVAFLTLYNPSYISIKFNLISYKSLRELLIYGSAGLLLNLCFLVIATSDRYIIAWFGSIDQVGVYDQVYKLSQLSVMALVTIFFNTINPTLINQLEVNYKSSKYLIRNYLKAIILLGFPIVFYLSFFSKDLASILLGIEFREGYPIMPFVFFAAYLHGISNFYELRLKFTNKFKKLSVIMIITTVLNLVLTIVFVKFYGYFFAAITTTFTYVILIFLFHIFDKEIIIFSIKNTKFACTLVILVSFQAITFFLLDYLNERLATDDGEE